MDFIKRSWLYLKNKLGRTILVLLALTSILSFVLSGLLVSEAAKVAGTQTANATGTTVILSANRQKIFAQQKQTNGQQGNNRFTSFDIPQVPLATVKKLAASKLVSGYQANSTASVTAKNFKPISTTENSGNAFNQKDNNGSKSSSTVNVSGVSSIHSDSNFSNKSYVIENGRGIVVSDIGSRNVIIESELATQDSLKVGDQLTVSTSAGKTVTLKIVGIYKAKTSVGNGFDQDPSNTLYSSYSLASSLSGYPSRVSSATFTMRDSSKTALFIRNSKKDISSKLTLMTATSTYKETAAAMKNIEKFADKIVWIVAVAGTLILSLLIILLTKDRRQEIGILMSMGESKLAILSQLMTEMIIILFVSTGLSVFIGNKVGNVLSAQLVSQQSKSQATLSSQSGMPTQQGSKTQSPMRMGNQSRNQGQQGDLRQQHSQRRTNLNKLKTTISFHSLIRLGGLGLVITTLATVMGVLPILRLRPREVLSKN